MSSFLISQILVGIALILNLSSYHFKNRKNIIWVMVLALAFISGHLFVLNEITSALLMLYAIVYFSVSTKTANKKVMSLFIMGSFLIFIFTYTQILDSFIFISTIFTLFALYNTDMNKMKKLQGIGVVIRIVYYIFIFSPVAILMEASLLTSITTSYFKERKHFN
jgi:hypothetical protein